jgi:hypothetical protein
MSEIAVRVLPSHYLKFSNKDQILEITFLPSVMLSTAKAMWRKQQQKRTTLLLDEMINLQAVSLPNQVQVRRNMPMRQAVVS